MSEATTKAQPAAPVVSDEQIRKTVESIQDPDTVPAFSNGYYTLTPDELRRAILALRAALQDKAGEVTVAIDNLYNERRDGMTNAIFPPVQIGTRLFAAQPAPVVPDDHPLMIFARECELGTYMEHEVPLAARKAVAASQKKG